MLAPHYGKDAELGEIRFAPQDFLNLVKFFRGKAVLFDNFGRDNWIGMARRLRHKDLRALSDSLQMLYRVSDLDTFRRRVFEAIGSLVRCDCFAYNEFGPNGVLSLLHCEPELPAESTDFLLSLGPEFTHENH